MEIKPRINACAASVGCESWRAEKVVQNTAEKGKKPAVDYSLQTSVRSPSVGGGGSLLRLQVIQKVGQIVGVFERKRCLWHIIDEGGRTRDGVVAVQPLNSGRIS